MPIGLFAALSRPDGAHLTERLAGGDRLPPSKSVDVLTFLRDQRCGLRMGAATEMGGLLPSGAPRLGGGIGGSGGILVLPHHFRACLQKLNGETAPFVGNRTERPAFMEQNGGLSNAQCRVFSATSGHLSPLVIDCVRRGGFQSADHHGQGIHGLE